MKIEITGEIETIIYSNEVNSYTVAKLISEEDTITIVGFLPFVNTGDTVTLCRRIYSAQRLWRAI